MVGFSVASEHTMRAIVRHRYGSADVLELAQIDIPVPGDDEVLVRVHAASLNTADLDNLRGIPMAARAALGLFRPRNGRMGLDLAGTVQAVGAKVDRLQPGDEVWADMIAWRYGSFAEYVCAPERVFALKPAAMSFEEAATMPHSAVLALQGLRGKGGINPGDKVLVNGAGGCVGPFAVQIAKSFGAEVTGVDSAEKLDLIRSVGADHVIDYTREDFTRGGQRYDFVLDIAGSRSVLRYRRVLSPSGRFVLIAHSLAAYFQAFILGAWVSMTSHQRMGNPSWHPSRREDLDLLGRLFETGQLKPVIDSRFPLSEVPDALRRLESGRARGKIVITVTEDGET